MELRLDTAGDHFIPKRYARIEADAR